MTRRNKAHKLLTSLLTLLSAFVLVGADLAALGQNTNSSTTTPDPSAQNTNANTTRRPVRRRGRRRTTRPAAAADAAATTDPSAATETTPPAETMPAADTTSTGAAQPSGGGMGTPGTEADLSGTYTGTIDAPGMNLSGPATLTITGNSFTLDVGGNVQSGTLSARQWPGQIAVSMRFGTELPANIVSLTARHRGTSLTLRSARGESKQFSFTTGGGGRRRRRAAAEAPPAETPPPPPPSN